MPATLLCLASPNNEHRDAGQLPSGVCTVIHYLCISDISAGDARRPLPVSLINEKRYSCFKVVGARDPVDS